MSFLRRLFPDPFIAVLILTVVLASVAPASGQVASAVGVIATAAIVLLFFLHGVRLPRESLTAALTHWRLHLTVLAATFVFFPLLGLALAKAFPPILTPALWTGVLFLCALPSTVQSSIAFTSMARGNVAATVTAAAASNLLGIALTPLIVGSLVQVQGGAISLAGVWKIVLQLLVPFALGHLCRPWLGAWAADRKRLLSFTDRGTIVLAVYSAFSAAVIAGIWHSMPLSRLLNLVAVCVGILTLALTIVGWGAHLLRFSREDTISIVFCGTQKSLVSGVPMARVLFAGPDVGAAVLPVMIYHQIQLMVGAWIARRSAAHSPTPVSTQESR